MSEELIFKQACPWPAHWIKNVEFSGSIQHGKVTIDVEAMIGPARIGETWGNDAMQWISRASSCCEPIPWHFFGAPFPGFGMITLVRHARFFDPLYEASSRAEDLLFRWVPHPNPPVPQPDPPAQALALAEPGAVDAEIIEVKSDDV